MNDHPTFLYWICHIDRSNQLFAKFNDQLSTWHATFMYWIFHFKEGWLALHKESEEGQGQEIYITGYFPYVTLSLANFPSG